MHGTLLYRVVPYRTDAYIQTYTDIDIYSTWIYPCQHTTNSNAHHTRFFRRAAYFRSLPQKFVEGNTVTRHLFLLLVVVGQNNSHYC